MIFFRLEKSIQNTSKYFEKLKKNRNKKFFSALVIYNISSVLYRRNNISIQISDTFIQRISHPSSPSTKQKKRQKKMYIRKKYSHGGEVVHHGVMVNLYEGLIVAVEVSPRSEPTYRNQHIPVPVIRVPLFPFRYNFPPPRRSPWVTSREHFGGPLSPPRINL